MSTDQGLQQAFEWQVTLWSGEASEEERAAFQRWHDGSAAHAQAWQSVQRLGSHLQGLAGSPAAGAALRAPHAAKARRQVLRSLLTVAGTGAVVLAARQTPQWAMAAADLRTGRGEQRQETLPDGTQLLLNTASAVDVLFTASERRLALRAGEIQVATAPDRLGRPFVVETPHGSARPIGTRFTVRLDGDASAVAVAEGAVLLASRHAPGQVQRLDAGQQARFDADRVQAAQPLSPLSTSWVGGVLAAEGMLLADFVHELGRYRTGVLRCDEAVAHLRVSGVYPLADTDRVLQALARALPVSVRSATRYWVTVGPR